MAGKECRVCGAGLGPDDLPHCADCLCELGDTWFEWDRVPFLADAGIRDGVVAVLELLDDDGEPFHHPLYAGDAIGRKPRAVFVPAAAFEAVRDCLARMPATWR